MSDKKSGFGDITPDDAYSAGDENVDWSRVDEVAEQIDAIQAISDDAERVEAAKRWAQEMKG